MKKEALLAGIVLVLVIIVGAVFFLKKDKKVDKPPVKEEKSGLSSISFNGLKLGDTPTDSMLNLVMDYDLRYEYKNIYFDVDKDNKIDRLRFNTSKEANGEIVTGIEDIEIKYKDKVLKTEEDFKNCFGDGQVSKEEFGYTILYEDEENELYVTIMDNRVINVSLNRLKVPSGDNKMNELSSISFNGLKLGDSVTEDMLNLVMDYDLRYEYKNIYFDVDKDNKITDLRLSTSTHADGEIVVGINTEKIEYKNKTLTTEEDFKNNFGEGTVVEDEAGVGYDLVFENEEVKLSVYVKDGKVLNVTLSKK